jgi:hypothetical protein
VSDIRAACIIHDLETYRTRNPEILEHVRREAIEKEYSNNTKKELKLEWDTERARNERAREAVEKTSVDPLLAEPVLFCYRLRFTGSSECVDDYVSFMEDDDCLSARLPELTQRLDRVIGPDTVWVGHNCDGFDLPVLLNSWSREGHRPPADFPRYRNGRWSGRVWDTMLRMPTKTPFISLENACRAYRLGEFPVVMWDGQAMDGSRVGAAYEAGAYQNIIEYCQVDVHQDDRLYQAQTFAGTWGTYDENSGLAERITAVERSEDLSPPQKALAILSLLDRAGRVPRAA